MDSKGDEYIEEIIKQVECNQYVDMKRLAFKR